MLINMDTLKTALDGLLVKINTEVNKSNVQPDWNQNDSEAKDYIKNKPFYSEENDELILAEGSFFEKVNYINHFRWENLSRGFSPGDFITVIFYDGSEWKEFIIADIAEQNDDLTIIPIKSNLTYLIKSITCEYTSSGFTIDIIANFQYVKVILKNKNAIHQIDSKYIKDMYYEDIKYITYIEEQEIYLEASSQSRYCSVSLPNINMPWDWVPYKVTFDGVEYEGIMTDNADNAWITITLNDGAIMSVYEHGYIYINSAAYAGYHTIKVEQKITNITTLDSKYLEFPAWGGKQFDSFGAETSIILNEKNNIASGQSSIAAGNNTEAHGDGSFTNGLYTVAEGYYSHAEGVSNKAYGYASYAGGMYNIQYKYLPLAKNTSFTEGLGLITKEYYYAYDYTWDFDTGRYTLVNPIPMTDIPPLNTYIIIGNTTSSIMYFNSSGIVKRYHSGYQNYLYDMKPGGIKYVATPTNSFSSSDKRIPLITIGNGESDDQRSNAYTLDRAGNGWFAGDVYVGSTSGTNMDEGSKKLITLDDIPEVEPQVFIVTQESTNEYEDLAEAIYNASQAGQIVIFQQSDNIYYLEYTELEPAHYASFYKVSNGGIIHNISIHGSTIIDSIYDPKNYVNTSIANLVDSAPETLNTLNELATAIQENDNIIDTLNTAIADIPKNTSQLTNDSGFITDSNLEDSVRNALVEAKNSGAFNGKNGQTIFISPTKITINPDGIPELNMINLNNLYGRTAQLNDIILCEQDMNIYRIINCTDMSGVLLELIGNIKGEPGTTPVKGTDYFTAVDKSEMVTQVKNAMPTLIVTGVDFDGVSHTWEMYGVTR